MMRLIVDDIERGIGRYAGNPAGNQSKISA
jgi:hypothetical protein